MGAIGVYLKEGWCGCRLLACVRVQRRGTAQFCNRSIVPQVHPRLPQTVPAPAKRNAHTHSGNPLDTIADTLSARKLCLVSFHHPGASSLKISNRETERREEERVYVHTSNEVLPGVCACLCSLLIDKYPKYCCSWKSDVPQVIPVTTACRMLSRACVALHGGSYVPPPVRSTFGCG